MERLTIPVERLPDGGTRMQIVDVRAVKEHAMELYWRLKKYEDTGLSPDDVTDLMGSHAVAIGELAKMPKWISVTERLPEVLTPVLVMHRYEPYDRVTIGYRFQPDKRRKPYWRFFAYWMGDDMMHHAIGDHMICPGGEYVTHWMPLPEPPKEVLADA